MIDKTVKGDWGVVSVGGRNTRQITGVAAGVKDTDAVNVAQLRALSNIVETMNAVDTILALTYEKNSQNRLSLKDAGTGVRISNVADGVDDKDAVNYGQLSAVSGDLSLLDARVASQDNNLTALQSSDGLSVKYEKNSQNRLSLKDVGTGVRISNVADGVADKDAVNYGQLSAVSGDLSILDARVASQDNNLAALQSSDGLSVKYDKNSQNRLSLKDAGTGVRISNVADGVDDKDAVNYGQLSAVSGDLSILDARVASQDRNLAALQSSDGLSVKYEANSQNRLSLKDAGTGVRISNVADGVDDKDAVNYGQLSAVSGDLSL
ncbi:hypothetical protein, partial [Cloacibacillus porcorum]